MNQSLERRVRKRAKDRCEYCKIPAYILEFTFPVDHIISQQQQPLGTDVRRASRSQSRPGRLAELRGEDLDGMQGFDARQAMDLASAREPRRYEPRLRVGGEGRQ